MHALLRPLTHAALVCRGLSVGHFPWLNTENVRPTPRGFAHRARRVMACHPSQRMRYPCLEPFLTGLPLFFLPDPAYVTTSHGLCAVNVAVSGHARRDILDI